MITLVKIYDDTLAIDYYTGEVLPYTRHNSFYDDSVPRTSNMLFFAEKHETGFIIIQDSYEDIKKEFKVSYKESVDYRRFIQINTDTRGKVRGLRTWSEYTPLTPPDAIRVSLYWKHSFSNLPDIGDVSPHQLIVSKVLLATAPGATRWGQNNLSTWYPPNPYPSDYSQTAAMYVSKTSPTGTSRTYYNLWVRHSYYNVWPYGYQFDEPLWPPYANNPNIYFITEFTGFPAPIEDWCYGIKDNVVRAGGSWFSGQTGLGYPMPLFKSYNPDVKGIYAVVEPV